MNQIAKTLVAIYLVISICPSVFAQQTTTRPVANTKPNIVIILSDDQGNADAGFQRNPPIVSTPAIDALASDGVIFTNGYASAYVCAPTRAGILTGRYQQRYGFYRAVDSRIGLPLNEITLAEVLKKEAYSTGIFGKWHLGLTEKYHPCNRGFDEFYGFLGHGAHDYFDLRLVESGADDFHQAIYRNLIPVSDTGYLTDNLAREACSFIHQNAQREDPFLIYLAFNAVHSPLQAPESDIKLFNTGDRNRDIQLAMLRRMDIAVGEVIKTLKDEGVYNNTIIFFLTDNGGAKASAAANTPLRDFKHSVYEGGLRVPFIICWPEKLNHSVCNEPVISLDIMPTICAALNIELPGDRIYDGKNILSAIGKKSSIPLHSQLFFDGNDGIWAIREGNWKLLYSKQNQLELYNLEEDVSEKHNVAGKYPERVEKMHHEYNTWRTEMGAPMKKQEIRKSLKK